MIPEPLHPAVVHFPIVLVMLTPVAALGAIAAIRRGAPPRTAWAAVFALAAALVASSFVATRSGQADEEVVEDVVAERVLEEHEESGERFLYLAGALLGVSTLGFLAGAVGRTGRYATLAGGALLVVAGWQVGHSGGELVYRHDAAAAHAARAQRGAPAAGLGQLLGGDDGERGEEGEDDD